MVGQSQSKMVSPVNHGGLGCSDYLYTRAYKVSKQHPSAVNLCVLTSRSSGAGFAALRFFTGLAEAPFFPGITLSESYLEALTTDDHALSNTNMSQ